jgi:hypothetical protein
VQGISFDVLDLTWFSSADGHKAPTHKHPSGFGGAAIANAAASAPAGPARGLSTVISFQRLVLLRVVGLWKLAAPLAVLLHMPHGCLSCCDRPLGVSDNNPRSKALQAGVDYVKLHASERLSKAPQHA